MISLIRKGISTEEIIAIEYVLLPDAPEEKLDVPHDDWVSSVCMGAFHGDKTLILSGSYDKCARVWSEKGELQALLQGHQDVVTGVSWATRGGNKSSTPLVCVTSSKDYSLRSWGGHGDSWHCVFQYAGHDDAVQAVACDPTGKHFCSAGWDRTLKIWAVPSDTEVEAALGPDEQAAAAKSVKRKAKASRSDDADDAAVKQRGCLSTLMGHYQAVIILPIWIFSPLLLTPLAGVSSSSLAYPSTSPSCAPLLRALLSTLSFPPRRLSSFSESMPPWA